MKKIFSIITVMVILMPQLINLVIIVDFNINQDYIAEVLCINNDKPKMKCNGKCHLTKELKKAEEPTEKSKAEFVQIRNEVLLCQNSFNTNKNKIIPEPTKSYCYQNPEFYKSEFVSDIFHPPKLIL
jgi:hypothetical protein